VELDGFFTSHQRDVLSDLVISKFINNACSHAGSHVMQLAESAALPIRLVQWSSGYISLSSTSRQLYLSLSPTSAPAASYSIQAIAHQHQLSLS
jgi:hypothetical protein